MLQNKLWLIHTLTTTISIVIPALESLYVFQRLLTLLFLSSYFNWYIPNRECGWRTSDFAPICLDPCAVCLERKCMVAVEGIAPFSNTLNAADIDAFTWKLIWLFFMLKLLVCNNCNVKKVSLILPEITFRVDILKNQNVLFTIYSLFNLNWPKESFHVFYKWYESVK